MALARRLLTKEELQESNANEMENIRFLAESLGAMTSSRRVSRYSAGFCRDK